MRIAIPVLNKMGKESLINEHFGHTPHFAFVELNEDGNYTVDVEDNPLESHGPGDIPKYLSGKDVNKLIVRGIGGRAIGFFQQMGIDVITGVQGSVEDIMESIKDKSLQSKPYTPKEKHHDH